MSFRQPDGSRFSGKVLGDEFQGWAETVEGHSIAKNPLSGYWEYGEVDEFGKLAPKGVKVDAKTRPPAHFKKHQRPVRDEEGERQRGEALSEMQSSRPSWRAGALNAPSADGASSNSKTMARSLLDSDVDETTGNRYLIIIMVNFADRQLSSTPNDWNSRIFGTAPTDKSVVNYYRDNSRGILNLLPVPHTQPGCPPGIVEVTVASNHPNSGFEPASYDKVVRERQWTEEAFNGASAFVDFASYANGVYTELVIHFIAAGYEAATTPAEPNVWAHSLMSTLTLGSAWFQGFSLSGELNRFGNKLPIGPLVHELGHSMCGLEDLYDYDDESGGLGKFSLMSNSWGWLAGEEHGTTPVDLDAWSRVQLGWVGVYRPGTDGELLQFPVSPANASVVMLGDELVSDSEFFLIENRDNSKWDAGMFQAPWAGGLLVLHIDSQVRGNNDYSASHYGVNAVPANTVTGADGKKKSDPLNLYSATNGGSFQYDTAPAPLLYSQALLGDGFSNASSATSTMTATFRRVGRTPEATGRIIFTEPGTPVPFLLDVKDRDGDSLSYEVKSWPAKGTLSGTAPNFTYTPAPGSRGTDQVRFQASDGVLKSKLATTYFQVEETPMVTEPVPLEMVLDEDSAGVEVPLESTDAEGNPLRFSIVSPPSSGKLVPVEPIVLGSYDTEGSSQAIFVKGKYAYLADWPTDYASNDTAGFNIIDISDPTNPVLVSSIKTLPGISYLRPSSLFVDQSIAYLGLDYGGLVLVDVSDPANPVKLSSLFDTSSVIGLFVSRGIAYVATAKGLLIYSVSDPYNPFLISTYLTEDYNFNFDIRDNVVFLAGIDRTLLVLDVSATQPILIGEKEFDSPITAFEIEGNIAYVATSSGVGLTMYDVSNPRAITELGGPIPYDTGSRLAISGGIAYATNGATRLTVMETQNLGAPSILYETSMSGIKDMVVAGDKLYLAQSDGGLTIIDAKQRYEPPQDFAGTDFIEFAASDGAFTSAPTTMSLVVTPFNDVPTIGGTPSTSVSQGSTYWFTPVASDVDEGDTLTFSITNKPSWASFSTTTGALTGTPSRDDVGTTADIVITVWDGANASASLPPFSLTVINANNAPIISGTPLTSVDEDSAYSFVPVASDTDEGDTLTFSIANKPAWASFSTTTGALTGTPSNADVGTTPDIVITVWDVANASASLPPFSLTVTKAKEAPSAGGKGGGCFIDTLQQGAR